RLRARPLSDLTNLVMIEISGGEQHFHVPLLHELDQLAHMFRRGRNAGLGLDVIDAGNTELAREIVPFLVVARHFFAAKSHALLEPAAEPVGKGCTIVAHRSTEMEGFARATHVVRW